MVLIDDTVCIVDSLGANNYRPNDALMKKSIADCKWNIKFYNGEFQYENNEMCGYFAIFVAKHLNDCKNLSISDVDNIVNKYFGKSADDNDIEEVINYFNLNKYIEKTGEGVIGDFLRNAWRHVKGVKMAIKGTRDNIKPSSRDALKKGGDSPIVSIKVCRNPIHNMLKQIVNWVNKMSLHKGETHDKLFHLFLIVTLANGHVYVVEKNQDINVTPFKPDSHDEIMNIGFNKKGLTIPMMLENTEKKIGKEAFYHYTATQYNCQHFVYSVLTSNGISVSPSLKSFIMQPVETLIPSWAKRVANFVTDVANRGSTLIHGEGNKPVRVL